MVLTPVELFISSSAVGHDSDGPTGDGGLINDDSDDVKDWYLILFVYNQKIIHYNIIISFN